MMPIKLKYQHSLVFKSINEGTGWIKTIRIGHHPDQYIIGILENTKVKWIYILTAFFKKNGNGKYLNC